MKSLYLSLKQFLRSVAYLAHDTLFRYMTCVGMVLQSAQLPDGATIALATTYGAEKDATAVSNANPGVATLEASHGVATGDFFEFTSGWSRLNQRIMKAGTVATNDVPLTGINTTDTDDYPIGTGTGTIREITAFTQISQILGFETSGGEPNDVTFSYLEENFERSLPGAASAQKLTITIADDATLAGYIALAAASESRALTALKMTLPTGAVILYNGIVFLNETPNVTKGQPMRVVATLSLQSKPTRF